LRPPTATSFPYTTLFRSRGSIGRTEVAVDRAFFRIRKLRDDGQAGERANRVNREEQFFDIRKSFENIKIYAALFESQRLLVKNIDRKSTRLNSSHLVISY